MASLTPRSERDGRIDTCMESDDHIYSKISKDTDDDPSLYTDDIDTI